MARGVWALAAVGLVGTHAYSILDARELGLIPGLNLGAGLLGQTRLVKLRNPWGVYHACVPRQLGCLRLVADAWLT